INIGKGTSLCANKSCPKFAGPSTASFCQPCAAMIMPTISRTISTANSESRAGSKTPNTLILTLLLLRSELERDVLPFLRVELIPVYGHWCAEFPRTLIFHRIAQKGSSRKLVFLRPHTYTVPGRRQARLISELPSRVLLGNWDA